jgi:hypothetical protein
MQASSENKEQRNESDGQQLIYYIIEAQGLKRQEKKLNGSKNCI